MSRYPVLAAVLATLAGAAQAQVTAPARPSPAAPVVTLSTTTTAPTPAMQRLMTSAQELRQSIQALAQKPPGAERDLAMAEAQKALLRTQQSMADLPPEYRQTTVLPAGNRGYDASVRTLMNAADTLRQSIHAMAREPAGPRRNQAIRDANRALLDTQVAMSNAYDLTAFAPHTSTLGAGPQPPLQPLQCTRLSDMWACS